MSVYLWFFDKVVFVNNSATRSLCQLFLFEPIRVSGLAAFKDIKKFLIPRLEGIDVALMRPEMTGRTFSSNIAAVLNARSEMWKLIQK